MNTGHHPHLSFHPSDPAGGRWSPLRSVLRGLSFAMILATTACSFYYHGEAKTGGKGSSSSSNKSDSSASAKASSNSSSKSKSDTKSSGKSSGSISAKASGKADGESKSKSSSKVGGKARGKKGLRAKFAFKSKSRVKGVGRSKKKDDFQAKVLIKGSGKASGSADLKAKTEEEEKNKLTDKTKADSKTKSDSKTKDKEKSKDKVVEKDKGAEKDKSKGKDKLKVKPDEKVAQKDKPKTKSKKTTKDKEKEKIGKKDKGPVVPAVVNVEPIDPPDEEPDNVFGYETPVRGCFEGIVYPLQAGTKGLPRTWNGLDALSAVYACEWDIPVRDWGQGFPGVDSLFEWFAIRYSGSFLVETAGNWNFRISSDDGAKLYIDGKLVINNDGEHPPKVAEGKITLSAGEHDMVLEYFQGPRYHINLQLFATPPGGAEGIFSVR